MRILLTALFLALALGACSRDDGKGGGPMERAGRDADRALNKAGQAIEKAGKNVQDAAKGDK
jgi:hypothetical protein